MEADAQGKGKAGPAVIVLCISIQEILLEMFSDNLSEGHSSTRLIKAPERDHASPLNDEDILERALDESDDYDSTTSFI